MRRQVGYATLLVGLTVIPACGQSLNISQNMRGNVYGILQFGPQVRSTTVVQTGQANIAGVMQVGANPSAAIRQSGQLNGAAIGQYENFLTGARAPMP